MESPLHSLPMLFDQLGLASDPSSIEAFISAHPLPEGTSIMEAPFWTAAQASLLREEMLEDADWSLLIDSLNERLHLGH